MGDLELEVVAWVSDCYPLRKTCFVQGFSLSWWGRPGGAQVPEVGMYSDTADVSMD